MNYKWYNDKNVNATPDNSISFTIRKQIEKHLENVNRYQFRRRIIYN